MSIRNVILKRQKIGQSGITKGFELEKAKASPVGTINNYGEMKMGDGSWKYVGKKGHSHPAAVEARNQGHYKSSSDSDKATAGAIKKMLDKEIKVPDGDIARHKEAERITGKRFYGGAKLFRGEEGKKRYIAEIKEGKATKSQSSNGKFAKLISDRNNQRVEKIQSMMGKELVTDIQKRVGKTFDTGVSGEKMKILKVESMNTTVSINGTEKKIPNKDMMSRFKHMSESKSEEKVNGMTLNEHQEGLKKEDHKQYLHDSGMTPISSSAYSSSVSRSHRHMDAIEKLREKK